MGTAYAHLSAYRRAIGKAIGAAQTEKLTASLKDVASHALNAVLSLRLDSGLWPKDEFVGRAPSPAKTALVLLGLERALSSDLPLPQTGLFGGAWGTPTIRPWRETIASSADQLAGMHSSWERKVEEDAAVETAHWVNPAYALGLAGCVSGGVRPSDRRLAAAWRYQHSLWSTQHATWKEPGGQVTIRAAYHAVRAYEVALQRQAGQAVLPDLRAGSLGSVSHVTITGSSVRFQFEAKTYTVSLSPRLLAVVTHLHDATDGASAHDFASALNIEPASVPKYIGRVNDRVREVTDHHVGRLIDDAKDGVYRFASG